MKVLALLNSVGDEGLRILESHGINLDADGLVYADVLWEGGDKLSLAVYRV